MKRSIQTQFSCPNRRQFIRQAGTALAFTSCASVIDLLPRSGEAAQASKTADRGLVGSNIFGWGQYARREKRKLDVATVISALRDTGYDYLENFMDLGRPENNARFAEQLKAKGLRPVSLYTGAALHEAGKAEKVVEQLLAAAKVCRQAGFTIISCNPNPIGREKTDAELETQVRALSQLGEGLHALGMQLGIHNHTPAMKNHAREFHYNFQHTQPDRVGFCFDVHWVWKGGVQPLAALQAYGNRVVTWHLRQSRKGVWYEILDSGDIDYPAVARFAKEHKLPRRFTVELALEGGTQVTRSVVENHRLSREYVRRVFGT